MMAYGNYMNNYTGMYQPQQTPTASQSAPIWVQGEAGAKSYLVAPNSTVTLWDSESHTIYLKSADAMGMPSMKILDYTIRGDAPSQIPTQNGYATKDDLDALRKEVERLTTKINERKEKK